MQKPDLLERLKRARLVRVLGVYLGHVVGHSPDGRSSAGDFRLTRLDHAWGGRALDGRWRRYHSDRAGAGANGVQPQVLTLHSDRGAPMTSQCTAQLLADLGVTRSLSRPQVSDDNPFSEAQFKTLKYHPSFPGRFDDQNQAKNFCRSFFRWYNTEHRHGGISMLTPEQVHFGLAHQVIARRKAVLREAWAARPERFVSGEPKTQPLPEAVWINPPRPTIISSHEIAL